MQILITLISNCISNETSIYCIKGVKKEGMQQVQIRWVSKEFQNSLNCC